MFININNSCARWSYLVYLCHGIGGVVVLIVGDVGQESLGWWWILNGYVCHSFLLRTWALITRVSFFSNVSLTTYLLLIVAFGILSFLEIVPFELFLSLLIFLIWAICYEVTYFSTFISWSLLWYLSPPLISFLKLLMNVAAFSW